MTGKLILAVGMGLGCAFLLSVTAVNVGWSVASMMAIGVFCLTASPVNWAIIGFVFFSLLYLLKDEKCTCNGDKGDTPINIPASEVVVPKADEMIKDYQIEIKDNDVKSAEVTSVSGDEKTVARSLEDTL
jgi:hypothetical protein